MRLGTSIPGVQGAVAVFAMLAPLADAQQPPLFGGLAPDMQSYARDAALADLDGDGLPEFVICTELAGDNRLRWRAGLGGGAFGALAEALSGQHGPSRMAVGDFAGGPEQDVAVSNRDSGSVSLFAGGPAGISSVQSLAMGPQTADVALADFEGDGDLDLLACNDVAPGGGLTARLNLGAGAWGRSVGSPAGRPLLSVVTGDLDADGLQDAVSAQPQGLAAQLGLGAGAFAPAALLGLGHSPDGLALGDVDGDGDLDALEADRESGALQRLAGDGHGHLAPPVSLGSANGCAGLLLADLDADGALDLILGDDVDAQVEVRLGSGGAAFGPAEVHEACLTDRGVTAGDADGDGHLDVVIAGGFTAGLLRGDGTGDLRGLSHRLPEIFGIVAAAPAQLDGDGHEDLFSSTAGPALVHTSLGDGAGSFVDHDTGPGGAAGGAVVADLDLDGADDAVFLGHTVVLTDGAGGIASEQGLSSSGASAGCVLADFSGQGLPDLASTGSLGVKLWHNLGQGSFASQGLFSSEPLGACDAGDLDLDGDLDVVAIHSSFQIGCFPGDGQDHVGAPLVSSFPQGATAFPPHVRVGDMNEDGKLDAVVAVGNGLRLLTGDGTGHLALRLSAEAPNAGSQLALADLDGDGHLDVAATGGALAAASILLGDGAGSLSSPTDVFGRGGGSSVEAGDWNGDGRADLVLGGGPVTLAIGVAADDDPWTRHGPGLRGVAGTPILTGQGTLLAGGTIELQLSCARPFASVVLVLGLSEAGLPLKGGVLVPSPDLLVGGLLTDAGGALLLSAPWPAGVPRGSLLVLQEWLTDAAAVAGVAASNGLLLAVP
jgi:hypothetical protein